MCKRGFLFKERKSSKSLLSGTKVVLYWSQFYETWSSRKIGDTVSGVRVSKRCNRATVQSHKFVQRLRKILVFEHKNAQFINFYLFCVLFVLFLKMFWTILFAQNFRADPNAGPGFRKKPNILGHFL